MLAIRKYIVIGINVIAIAGIIKLAISEEPADDFIGFIFTIIIALLVFFDIYALILYVFLRALNRLQDDIVFFVALLAPLLYFFIRFCR